MTNTESEQLRTKIEEIVIHSWDCAVPKGVCSCGRNQDVNELLALFQSHQAQIKQDIFKKVEGIISIEPSALIPRTQEHLEAYRQKLETRNQFREELRSSLKALGEGEMK